MSDLHPFSGAYAVDALDDLERARFEHHLAECPDCADEVRSLKEAASMLALTVDPTPFDMRSRILAEIATVRPLPPQTQRVAAVRRTARRFPRLVAASAAAVLLIGGFGVAASKLHTPDQPGQQVAAESVSAQVMEAADARTQSIAFDNGSKATLYHSKSVGRAVLVTQGMDSAPLGKSYEMWFQAKDGTFVPAGLITAGGNQTVVLHGNLGTSKGVGITVEPASGSTTPSSLPIAMFELAKSV